MDPLSCAHEPDININGGGGRAGGEGRGSKGPGLRGEGGGRATTTQDPLRNTDFLILKGLEAKGGGQGY